MRLKSEIHTDGPQVPTSNEGGQQHTQGNISAPGYYRNGPTG